MPEYDWDLVVIGGGLAGSAAATLLARAGWSVGLIEQGDFQRPRVGEVVAYQVVKWLRDHLRLDLFSSPEVVFTPVNFRVLWGDHSAPQSNSQPLNHIRIDRLALERCLFNHAARSGVCAISNAKLRAAIQGAKGWEFEFLNNGKIKRARAKFVIEATGRTSYSPFTSDRQRLYEDASIACAIRVPQQIQRLNKCVWIESHEQGWWYLSELPNSECLIVFFTDRDLMPTRADQRAEWIGEQWVTTKACTEVFSGRDLKQLPQAKWSRHDARMSLRCQSFGEGWMAIGDSQMALDPLSGQGIMEALKSASMASELLTGNTYLDDLDWTSWAQALVDRYQNHRAKRLEQYCRESSFANAIFWKRRSGLIEQPSRETKLTGDLINSIAT